MENASVSYSAFFLWTFLPCRADKFTAEKGANRFRDLGRDVEWGRPFFVAPSQDNASGGLLHRPTLDRRTNPLTGPLRGYYTYTNDIKQPWKLFVNYIDPSFTILYYIYYNCPWNDDNSSFWANFFLELSQTWTFFFWIWHLKPLVLNFFQLKHFVPLDWMFKAFKLDYL